MPKTPRSRSHLCSNFSPREMDDFRALVMELGGGWRTVPAMMFFNSDGTPKKFDEVCMLLPEEIYTFGDQFENKGPNFWVFKKEAINTRYRVWERMAEFKQRRGYVDYKNLLRKLEDAVANLPFKERIAAARAELFKMDPYISALVMVDPLGRPLNIRGLAVSYFIVRNMLAVKRKTH